MSMPADNRSPEGSFAPGQGGDDRVRPAGHGQLPAGRAGRCLRNGPNPLGLDDPDHHWPGLGHGARRTAARRQGRVVRQPVGPLQGRRGGAPARVAAGPVREHGLRRQHLHRSPTAAGLWPPSRPGRCRTRSPTSWTPSARATSAGRCPTGSPRIPAQPRHRRTAPPSPYFWAWDYVEHVIVGPARKVYRHHRDRRPGRAWMMHDFAPTGRHVVLLNLPVTFSLERSPGQGARPTCGPTPTPPGSDCCPATAAGCSAGSRSSRAGVPLPQRLRHEQGQVVVDLCQYDQGFDVSTLWSTHRP